MAEPYSQERMQSLMINALEGPAAAFTQVPVVIASGQSLSAEINLVGYTVVRIVMPSGWDTAVLTFQGANASGGTFGNLYDASGNEYTIQAAVSRRIMVPPSDLLGNGYMKVRSGTAASAVAQSADRTLTLIVRPL